MPTATVEIIVHRAEMFYFAHMDGWQSGMAMPLTRKYSRWHGSDENLAFASDAEIDDFWRQLDERSLGERFTLDVPPAMSTSELIGLAMRRAQQVENRPLFENETLQGLYHLESGAKIEPGHAVDEYLVEHGDHLGLIIQHPPAAFYSLVPTPNSEAVFAAIRSTDENPPSSDPLAYRDYYANESSKLTRPLRGVLLYTDEDVEVATYTRKHFASLSEASGTNLHLYIVEQPEGDWREASRYWKGVLSEQLQREWATFGWLRSKPYTAVEAYKIARRMGIYPDQLPCLVLFDQLENDEKVIFPLLSGSAKFFRSLFSSLQRLIVPGQPTSQLFEGVRQNFDEILAILRESADVMQSADRIEYRFEGQTVFINKPTGSVTLSNFQNRSDDEQRGETGE